jgi:hypothetical protein
MMGRVDRLVEVVGVEKGPVGQIVCLEVMPYDLNFHEFMRILWQPRDRSPVRVGGGGRQRELARTDRAVVRDEHDRFGRTPGLSGIGRSSCSR